MFYRFLYLDGIIMVNGDMPYFDLLVNLIVSRLNHYGQHIKTLNRLLDRIGSKTVSTSLFMFSNKMLVGYKSWKSQKARQNSEQGRH